MRFFGRLLSCFGGRGSGLSEVGASGETDALAGGKVNGLAATNGFDGARRDGPGLPGAKADDADLVAFGDLFLNGRQQRV